MRLFQKVNSTKKEKSWESKEIEFSSHRHFFVTKIKMTWSEHTMVGVCKLWQIYLLWHLVVPCEIHQPANTAQKEIGSVMEQRQARQQLLLLIVIFHWWNGEAWMEWDGESCTVLTIDISMIQAVRIQTNKSVQKFFILKIW